MQTQAQVICPNCKKSSYANVTGEGQGFTCPFCNFSGKLRIQQTQTLGQPVSTQTIPMAKERKSYSTIIIAVVVIILFSSAFVIIFDPFAEEEGEPEIIRVYHDPPSPGTDDTVYFYAEITNCPASLYDVIYHVEVYNGSIFSSSSGGGMYKSGGLKDHWTHAEMFTSTGFNSGYEVRFWVEVFDKNRGADDEFGPILTSEIDSFIIS